MRAFKPAVLLMLSGLASALERQTVHINDLKAEKPIRTETFNFAENTFQEKPALEGSALVGIIIGYCIVIIFFALAAYLIITDEIKRHRTYEALIARDIRRLKNECNQTPADITRIDTEFDEAEANRGKKIDATAAALELAEIN